MSVTKAVKKNEIVTFHVTGYTSEGSGVGRLNDQPDGLAVFIPHAAVGDFLKVRIVKPASHYAFGRIEEILVTFPRPGFAGLRVLPALRRLCVPPYLL